MTYFNNVNSLNELRTQYKSLLKKYHPDNGGSEESTKEINAEYDNLFRVLKSRQNSEPTGQEDTQNDFNAYTDSRIKEMIQHIITFTEIDITVCGTWIWVSGNTYQYKKVFNELGFIWSSKRKMWYWHDGEYHRKSRNYVPFTEIEQKYGSMKVKAQQSKQLSYV